MRIAFDRLVKFTAAMSVVAATVVGVAAPAQAESPFHTGVWQLNKPTGPEGLILSDWLVYENGLPARWLYRKAGTNDLNQFDFFIRNLGEPNYLPANVRVYRTGEHEMKYSLHVKNEEPVEYSANRLSIPNYKNSCLSVENKGERLFGHWRGTSGSTLKRLHLAKNKMTIDGKSREVQIMPVRVGRLGIVENGRPIAFLTDGGGDYAVLQWFRDGVTTDVMVDPAKEILDFAAEEIVKDPKTNCDQQIASRLRAMKK